MSDLGPVLATHVAALRAALGHAERETATHLARRALKQIRGILRLAAPRREQRTGAILKCERQAKSLADSLAPARDQRVAARTAEKLMVKAGDDASAILAVVAAEQHDEARRLESASGTSGPERRMVADLARGLTRLALRRSGGDLASAVRRSHRKAARRLAGALAANDPRGLHEARTAIVRLHAQLEALDGLVGGFGRKIRAHAKRLDALRSVLGEHHDLVLLGPLVAARAASPKARRDVFALLDGRLRKLERKAARLHAEAFAGKLPGRRRLARLMEARP